LKAIRRSIAAVSVERLAELIRERAPCVVLTGAGVSTESGIPDFRSPTGIWADVDPMEYGSLRAFQADPEKIWSFYTQRIEMLRGAEPNDAHYALAELERRGFVSAVVTQNIDLLHTRAGSREVVEMHGSIRTASCPACGASFPLDESLLPVPRCSYCGAVLKPDVVFFGELLPRAAIDRAYELAQNTKLMIVVGSALEVYPVADLPLETVRAGGSFVIVNRGPTALDDEAVLRVDGTAGETLRGVATVLG
jgi:NAD-dependent protein deacetylase/lipoamidase